METAAEKVQDQGHNSQQRERREVSSQRRTGAMARVPEPGGGADCTGEGRRRLRAGLGKDQAEPRAEAVGDAVCRALPGDGAPEARRGTGLMLRLPCAILGMLKCSRLSGLLRVREAAPGQKTSQLRRGGCVSTREEGRCWGCVSSLHSPLPLLWALSPWAMREAAEQHS